MSQQIILFFIHIPFQKAFTHTVLFIQLFSPPVYRVEQMRVNWCLSSAPSRISLKKKKISVVNSRGGKGTLILYSSEMTHLNKSSGESCESTASDFSAPVKAENCTLILKVQEQKVVWFISYTDLSFYCVHDNWELFSQLFQLGTSYFPRTIPSDV